MNEAGLCGTWVRPPFEGLSHPGLGVALCLLLLLTALGATWKVLAPGGITPGERRAHHPRFQRAARLFGILLLAAPWLVTAGAALFVVPLRPPRTAVLVSRSRVPASEELWQQQSRELARKLRDVPRPFDAGPLVGKALSSLRSPSSSVWEIDDPYTAQEVVRVVREVLDTEDLTPLPSGVEALDIPAPASDLPRWLVESIEISLLQGLTRRYNVEQVHALVAQRRTAVGRAWDGVEPLLAGRAQCPKASLVQIKDQQPFTLQSAVPGRRTPSGGCSGIEIEIALVTAAACQVLDLDCAAPAPPTERPLDLLLLSRGTLVGEHRSTVSLLGQERWVRQTLCFEPTGTAMGDRTHLEIRTREAPFQILPVKTPKRSARSQREAARPALWSSGPVRVLAPAASAGDWTATERELLGAHPEAIAWRKRMENLGFDLEALRGGDRLDFYVQGCDAREDSSAEVTLDACAPDEGVWIYPSAFQTKRKTLQAVSLEIEPEDILRGHVPPRGLPGTDSWAGVPLVSGAFFRPAGTSFLPHAAAHVLPDRLLYGSSPQSNLAWPVVTRAELPNGNGGLARVTHLGFDPAAQGLLLDPAGSPRPGFDPHRFFAGWTQIVEALHAAGADAPRWSPEDASAALGHPRTFLSGRDLARIAGRGLEWPLATVILGVLLHALLVMLGLRTLPRRSQAS